MYYLYNGAELPVLPEWDKQTYPYAVIAKATGSHRYLFMCVERPYYDGSKVQLGSSVLFSNFYAKGTGEVWSEPKETTITEYSGIFWTNTDILNSDGTIYLATSEPIPITAPVLDPLSLWLGWKAGNWVARQRGKA